MPSIISEMSAEAENDLEWIAYHINMVQEGTERLEGFPLWQFYPLGHFQELVLRNNGCVPHTVRFGIYFADFDDTIRESLFMVNGTIVQQQFKPGGLPSHAFMFYDVVFPLREETRIRVHYLLVQPYSSNFESRAFNGTPIFTATIGNCRLNPSRPYFEIEQSWITDIVFTRNIGHIIRWGHAPSGVSFMSILEREGSLSNDYFALRKTNGNTWEIEFTSRFVEEHRETLAFGVIAGDWGWSELGGFRFNVEDAMTPYRHIFLTNRQLRVVRNAIFARYGFVFANQNLRRMFEGLRDPNFGNINYRPNPNFHEGLLTETDRANIAVIQRLEALSGD